MLVECLTNRDVVDRTEILELKQVQGGFRVGHDPDTSQESGPSQWQLLFAALGFLGFLGLV